MIYRGIVEISFLHLERLFSASRGDFMSRGIFVPRDVNFEDYVVSRAPNLSQKTISCLGRQICVSNDEVVARKANLCLRILFTIISCYIFWFYNQILRDHVTWFYGIDPLYFDINDLILRDHQYVIYKFSR